MPPNIASVSIRHQGRERDENLTSPGKLRVGLQLEVRRADTARTRRIAGKQPDLDLVAAVFVGI
jgi:hypothetical protein